MINSISSGGYSTAMMGATRSRGAQPETLAEQLLAAADSDQDNSISQTEFLSLVGTDDSSTAEGLFASLDSDGDGALSQSEAQDAFQGLLDQMRSETLLARSDMPPPPPPDEGDATDRAEAFMSSADTDGSGGLDATEFATAMQGMGGPASEDSSRIEEMFSDADSDGDGTVTSEELAAAMANHRPPPPPPSGAEDTQESSEQVASTESSEDALTFTINALLERYRQNSSIESISSSTLSVSA